jgi:hypothetical protein
MPLSPGTLLGLYKVPAPLGAGGMGDWTVRDVGRTLSPRGALSSALAGLGQMAERDWESRAG